MSSKKDEGVVTVEANQDGLVQVFDDEYDVHGDCVNILFQEAIVPNTVNVVRDIKEHPDRCLTLLQHATSITLDSTQSQLVRHEISAIPDDVEPNIRMLAELFETHEELKAFSELLTRV
ncbi:hypothetical protein [Thiolapillus sp.]|uniref:hypothetical protein n=1 Tax=Thiolapillus sp. TaxID=2017437 RepID=UPI003AF53916